jgi:hypothetical protein
VPPTQLDTPIVSEYFERPYDGIDFALFDVQGFIVASAGLKEAFRIAEWPVVEPIDNEEVVTIGYTRDRMRIQDESLTAKINLDAYAGCVTGTDT